MLDDEHRVATLHHAGEEVDDAPYVVGVKAVGGLIDDEHLALVAQVRGHLEALELAARQGAECLVEMEVLKAHVGQWAELLLHLGAGEERHGLADGEVEHGRDVEVVIGVLQGFGGEAAAAACLADGLDGVHEGHLGHDDALATAHGAGATAVEREVLLFHVVLSGKELAYVARHIHVGGRGGTEADADVLLADIHHADARIRIGPGGASEALHERALARACHARHHAEDAQRQPHLHVAEVVQRGIGQREPAGGRAHGGLQRDALVEHVARDGAGVQKLVVRALEQDLSALGTRTGPHVHDVVGNAYHLLVMLDEQHGVAMVAKLAYRLLEQGDVVVVEANAGFVEDVEHIRERRVDVLGNLASLGLAPAERADGAVEAQVAEANLLKGGEALEDGGLDIDGQRVIHPSEPLAEAAHGQGTGLGDVQGVAALPHPALKHTGIEARAATVGTGAHGEHGVEHGGMEQALLAVDDAPVHARYEALVLGRLGPVGWRVLELYLGAVQEEVEFLGRVVANLLVEVEQAAVGIAYPSPATLVEGDVVYGVLIVQALVEIHQLVNVELAYLAQARAARAAPLRMVERERVRIAHERLPHAREEQAHERIDIGVRAHGGTGVLCGLLLVDDDGNGQPLDAIDVGAAVLGQVLLHEGGKGVVELAAALGGDGVHHQRRLATAAHAREDGDAVFGQGERDVLEVVFRRSTDNDAV